MFVGWGPKLPDVVDEKYGPVISHSRNGRGGLSRESEEMAIFKEKLPFPSFFAT